MFEYLTKYLYQTKETVSSNSFYSVKERDIKECEKFLGYPLPSQLRKFYEEIGYGFLTHPHKYDKNYHFYNTNRINSPCMITEIMQDGQPSGLISQDAYEDLQPGDLPFFEISDSSSFLKMKALSDNPNAVWDMSDYAPLKIADSLEEFIYKLYYEDPGYYGKIYTEFCQRMNF